MHKIGLKILPVLSFHQCCGNIGDTVHIPIPKFVFEQEVKPYFVDRFNQINDEYISFSYDNIKLGERTLEMYDEMFREKFAKDAKEAGHPEWTSPPNDIGDGYNVYPGGPTFWTTGYKTEYGKFFLSWYSQKLIEHGREVLRTARKVFPTTEISGKVAGIHWQYLNEARSAEATAGYYNTNGNDGYSSIAKMFKEEDIDFCFTCLEMRGQDKYSSSDQESLVKDVFEIATKNGLSFEGENAIECYNCDAYNQILKWKNKGMREFTFLRMTDKLMNNERTWTDFVKFTKQMHNSCYQDDEEEEEDCDSEYEKESCEFYNLKCEYNLL